MLRTVGNTLQGTTKVAAKGVKTATDLAASGVETTEKLAQMF